MNVEKKYYFSFLFVTSTSIMELLYMPKNLNRFHNSHLKSTQTEAKCIKNENPYFCAKNAPLFTFKKSPISLVFFSVWCGEFFTIPHKCCEVL